jgi:citrate lyase subunit beta/citryl-CoA lyase
MNGEASIGSNARGDCLVVARRTKTTSVEVLTRNDDLLLDGVRAVAEETLERLGVAAVSLRVEASGALDYVIRARIEAALRVMNPSGFEDPGIPPDRQASERDRPRRSRLYAPGNNPRLLAGIDVHGADCVLLDLEDSVPVGEKEGARILVRHLLCAVRFPEEVWVRINSLDAGGGDDLAEVLRGRPHGVCLPKAGCARDVHTLVEAVDAVEARIGLERGSIRIMPIVETARGVLHCEEIAAAHDRVVLIAFGAEDYTREVGARRTDEALLFARSRIVAAARVAGVQVSDTVLSDVSDETRWFEEARRARDLGFDGKGAINPRQIEAIHRAFSPSDEELESARAIVAAAREAEAKGWGSVAVDGRMVDRPVVARAERTIELADKQAKGGPL